MDWLGYCKITIPVCGAVPAREIIHHVPNGGSRNKIEAAKLKGQGVLPGVWDIVCPVPVVPYAGLYIEMKAGRNTLTKDQERFGRYMAMLGHRCETCYDWTQAKAVTQDYLGSLLIC